MVELQLALPNGGSTADLARVLKIAEAAEACGFTTLWAYDHVLPSSQVASTYGEVLEPLTLLAHLAGRVSRVRLGTSVLVVPLRNPVVVAKQVAMVDILSEGRFVLGVGAGYMQQEFVNLHQEYHTRGARLNEAILLFRHLFSGTNEPFVGKYYGYSDGIFGPAPVQGASLPIMVGGHSDAAVKRAAQLGDIWQASGIDPPRFRERLALLKATADGRQVSVGARIGAITSRSYGEWMPLDSAELMASISDWEDAGAEHVTLNFGSHDGFLERMLRFGDAFAASYSSIRATRAANSQAVTANAPTPAGVALEDTIALKGNLAPLGAICRPVRNGMRWQRAQAKVFDSPAAATSAILGGKVPSATVVVVRYQDSIAPGKAATDLLEVLDAIVAADLSGSVSLLTDGRTDRNHQCLAVQCATPGASLGGPLAGLWDGDMICIDLQDRRIDVEYVDLKVRLASASRSAGAKGSQRK